MNTVSSRCISSIRHLQISPSPYNLKIVKLINTNQLISSVRSVSSQASPLSSINLRNAGLRRNRTSAYYAVAVLLGFLGLTYAAVPVYRIVCQKTGFGGTPMTDSSKFTAEHMVPVPTATGRRIKVSFSASTSDTLPWSFRPLQREISLLPGETALAFYKARN